ncbi:hypothetical protein ACWGI9_44485 [Streptomyces sp. NPDC054833]
MLLVLGAALVTLFGVIPASAASDPSGTSQPKASSAVRAAGPERHTLAANARPSSGNKLEAGPNFKKVDGSWQVRAAEVTLRNTVTDPDGDKANLTFEVWTVDKDGKPKDRVKLTDTNQWGVLVSDYVPSGKSASVPVDYGKLHPGWTYVFHTNAYDGNLYEQGWSNWATFTVAPYVTFPAPQASSTIDPKAQTITPVNRTEPGTFVPVPLTKQQKKPAKPSCGKPDAQGRKLCWEFPKPGKKSPAQNPAVRAAASQYDLLPWCDAKAKGGDYMNRTEACMRDLGRGTLIFTDTEPGKPPLGTAEFEFEQRIKAYPAKKDSDSNFAEFDQQLLIIPWHIDPQLQMVRMQWRIGSDCKSCTTSKPIWQDDYGAYRMDASFTPAPTDMGHILFGNVQTQWTGTGKETIDLAWHIDASVDAGGNLATADFGGTGIPQSRELAPRCDDIYKTMAPGCVLPGFSPTWTVDTNLYPAAGAYYWLMQENMATHAGAHRWDSLLHYLGPDTTLKDPADGTQWNSDKNRQLICQRKWKPHSTPASVGKTSCDEYAMASTRDSGGTPGGVNHVTDGSQCAQLYQDTVSSGNAAFGLLTNVGQDPDGLSTKEKCGRAALNADQNSGAFKGYPAPEWRMLDNDGFFVALPGFDQCKRGVVTCTWQKVG